MTSSIASPSPRRVQTARLLFLFLFLFRFIIFIKSSSTTSSFGKSARDWQQRVLQRDGLRRRRRRH